MAGKLVAAVTKQFGEMDAHLKKFTSDSQKVIGTAEAVAEKEYKSASAVVSQEVSAYNKAVSVYNAQRDKLVAEFGKAFIGARQEYMEVVKRTNGLTSVKPSVVKALEKYRDTADDKCLSEAASALKKHKEEVLKAAGKGDAKAAAFAKEIDALVKACE